MSYYRPPLISPARRLLASLKSLPLSVALIGAGALMSSPRPASATVALKATVESLTEQADLIVVGRVTARWTPKERGPQGQIYTRTTLEVSEVWKGSASGSVVVQQLGGTLDGFTLQVSGSPNMTVGEDCVLFLVKGAGEGDLYHVVSLAQGVFHVSAPSLTPVEHQGQVSAPRSLSQDLGGITFYQATPARGPESEKAHLTRSPEPTQAWTLNLLKAQVIALVRAER